MSLSIEITQAKPFRNGQLKQTNPIFFNGNVLFCLGAYFKLRALPFSPIPGQIFLWEQNLLTIWLPCANLFQNPSRILPCLFFLLSSELPPICLLLALSTLIFLQIDTAGLVFALVSPCPAPCKSPSLYFFLLICTDPYPPICPSLSLHLVRFFVLPYMVVACAEGAFSYRLPMQALTGRRDDGLRAGRGRGSGWVQQSGQEQKSGQEEQGGALSSVFHGHSQEYINIMRIQASRGGGSKMGQVQLVE